MTRRITIPATIEAATESLNGLDALLTAKEWERAAIVYAFTHDAPRGRQPANDRNRTFTVAGFAALKITGLHRRETIAYYRDNWKAAIVAGKATDIDPGDKVTLPDMDWPGTRGGTRGYETWEGAKKTLKLIVTKHGDGILDEIHPPAPAPKTTTPRAKPSVDDITNAIKTGDLDPREIADALPARAVTGSAKKRVREAMNEQMEDEWADDPEGLNDLKGLIGMTDALNETSKEMQDGMLGSHGLRYLGQARSDMSNAQGMFKSHGVDDDEKSTIHQHIADVRTIADAIEAFADAGKVPDHVPENF